MKEILIAFVFMIAFADAGESGSGEKGSDCCVDGVAGCKEWMCDYQGGKWRHSCPATCHSCANPGQKPPYHNYKLKTSEAEVNEINRICATEQNRYPGVNLQFDSSIAYHAQLYAEYMVEKDLMNVHDCFKRNLFPQLKWLVGNLMPYNDRVDHGTALKDSIYKWYNKVSTGIGLHNQAMTGQHLVGCGVATNGKITRVVAWYGTANS